ncbi:MAG: hypothetical protein K9M10_01120 [Candidatus Pacebacteria bacterium]|nr:hypothetical protein [Candidatus Paceibacterota bacterium]MCF7857064.1 hypothetical protein [Candidatus Paceibacterota bacterium]
MLSFGHRDHNKARYAAVIDIGSGTVGVAIVASLPNKSLPTLLYTHRTSMRITKQNKQSVDDIRRVRETLLSECLLLSQDGYAELKRFDPNASITKLHVTCASPWAYTQEKNVQYTDDENFKVTHSVIDDLVQTAETEIADSLKEAHEITALGFDIVEESTVDIKINGYSVENPFHLSGKTLSLSHIAGLLPKEIINTAYEVQEKLFPNSELNAHTFMLVIYCVLRNIFPKVTSACVINITAEATEFGLVRDGVLLENNSLPYGINSFIREIMEKTNKPEADVSTILRSFSTDTHTRDTEIKKYIDLYKEKAYSHIVEMLEKTALPKTVIVSAQEPHQALLKEIVSSAFLKAELDTSNIISIETSLLAEIPPESTNDLYLAISAYFFHTLDASSEVNKN